MDTTSKGHQTRRSLVRRTLATTAGAIGFAFGRTEGKVDAENCVIGACCAMYVGGGTYNGKGFRCSECYYCGEGANRYCYARNCVAYSGRQCSPVSSLCTFR